jgi:hypothetical protein
MMIRPEKRFVAQQLFAKNDCCMIRGGKVIFVLCEYRLSSIQRNVPLDKEILPFPVIKQCRLLHCSSDSSTFLFSVRSCGDGVSPL